MKTASMIICLLVFTSLTNFVAAQQAASNQQQSLKESFEELKDKSSDYEIYEVIKESSLDAFWQEISDTLKARQQEFSEAKNTIGTLNNKIKGLEATIVEKDKAVAESQYLIDHIYVLGIPINKTVYMYLNFFIIIGLALFIGAGYKNYKSSIHTARAKTDECQHAIDESEDYRKKAKEKEMKLRRELQTYINKNEELKKQMMVLKKN